MITMPDPFIPESTSSTGGHQEAPAVSAQDPTAAGALVVDQLPGPFDPAAITTADNLDYVTLKLMDDHRTPDLPAIPDEQAFFDAIEPPPLFLQRCA